MKVKFANTHFLLYLNWGNINLRQFSFSFIINRCAMLLNNFEWAPVKHKRVLNLLAMLQKFLPAKHIKRKVSPSRPERRTKRILIVGTLPFLRLLQCRKEALYCNVYSSARIPSTNNHTFTDTVSVIKKTSIKWNHNELYFMDIRLIYYYWSSSTKK